MSTAKEFVKAGITGQTFREIREKFGQPLDKIGDEDKVMSLYALGFAWVREREQLPVQAAYDKAMGMTPAQVEGLFEDASLAEVEVAADFDSPPPKMTP